MKNALIATLISGIVLLVLACSGTPDAINPNPPLPGPGAGAGPILTLTDEERIAVLKESSTFAEALGDLRLETTQEILVAWLKNRREFEAAGKIGGNVWAYFYDGRSVMFVPDWLDEDSYNGRVAAPDVSGGRTSTEGIARTGEVPGGKKVMLFHGLGNAYADNRPYLLDIFSKSHTQYQAEGKDATIERLKDAKDVDIFYINTHCGFANIRPLVDSAVMYSLWTSDTITTQKEELYKEDLDQHALNYMVALEDRGPRNEEIYETHYAIGPLFVRKYMTFGENSMMYIDACSSLDEYAFDLMNEMRKAAKKHLATYIGWSDVSDQGTGFPTSRFIFDRLLGSPVFMPETPLQRPFDLDNIFKEFPRYNLGISGYGGRLEYEAVSESEIILTPSIEYITVEESESRIFIQGLFGDNARADGKVTVGGITVPFSDWYPNLILCELPLTGPGSSGNVIVSVNGHESNIVPLSEWNIPLHLIKDDFGVKIEANLNLKIRADLHKYRLNLEETPRTERPEWAEVPGSLGSPFSLASTGNFKVHGQRLAYCVRGKCSMRDTESFPTKNGVLPYSTHPGESLGFGAYYQWSNDLKTLVVNVIVNIPDCGVETEVFTFCEGEEPITISHSGAMPLGIITTDGPGMPVLQFHLDENYNIKEGNIHGMQNIAWGRCADPGYFKHSATWPEVTPPVRPRNNTEGRYAGGD